MPICASTSRLRMKTWRMPRVASAIRSGWTEACLVISFHHVHVGRFPRQMLATIDRDHLAGDSLGFEKIAHRVANILGFGPRFQNSGLALMLEIRLALARVAHGGAWTDAVNADARAHALRQGGRQPVKPGL